MKKFSQAALLSAALLPVYASAADFSYNYVQASYVTSDDDVGDGDGFSFDGSFELNKDIALVAGYESTSIDESFFFFGFDLDVLAIGAAYHMPVDDKMDAVFSGGLLDGEVSYTDGRSFDDTGTFLSAGLRVQPNPQMEFGVGLKRIDLFDESDVGIELTALMNIDKKNQIGLSFSNVQDIDNLYFRFRANF